jgi:iron(III) transport system substrate-binding protein
MRRKFLVAILALLPLVAVPALSRAAEPSAAEEWNQVTAAAKKEGEVVVYNAAIGADYYKAVTASFEKHYGIRVRTLDVRASEITERLRTEQSAGRFIGDVVQHGQATLLLNPWMVQPHGLLPDQDKLRPPFKVTDVAVPSWVQAYGILVSDDVPAEHRPTGWHSLLEARWTGKILSDDMRATGGGAVMFAAFQDAFGPDFNDALAKQNPTFDRDLRNDEQRVARGEFPVYIPEQIAFQHALAGLPVTVVVPEEGCPYVEIDGAMLKNAPHPNAARLLLNWFISPEAQLAYAKGGQVPVRQDALDLAPPDLKPMLNCKLLGTTTPDKINAYFDMAKKLYKK